MTGAPAFLLAQISDPHIGATWADSDPVARLATVVAAIREMPRQPDAVLVSGDIADQATDDEYRAAGDLVGSLGLPAYVAAGNHDDRAGLQRQFGVPTTPDGAVQYARDLGPARLVVLDSTTPGHEDGDLDAERLAWLEEELRTHSDVPALIVLHHPPIDSGVPALDRIGLAGAARSALADVLTRNPQVVRVVAGHFHRAVTGACGSRPVFVAPSTYVEARFDLDLLQIELVPGPPGFALHVLRDDSVASHVQWVTTPAPRATLGQGAVTPPSQRPA